MKSCRNPHPGPTPSSSEATDIPSTSLFANASSAPGYLNLLAPSRPNLNLFLELYKFLNLYKIELASKVKSLALSSRPQALENWPVLGSRTAVFFELLKFCEVLEKFFGKRFFVGIA